MTIHLRLLATTALTACAHAAIAPPAAAQDAPYVGSVHASGQAEAFVVRGTVFLDENRNAMRDDGEAGIEGVMVSNGREVVLTDADGAYELPAHEDMNVFITKPAGHAVPVDEDMVPQFSYAHKPAGSPPLRYGGLEPTGALPEAIDFPLIETGDDARFEILAFGDTQTYSHAEIGYVRETVGRLLLERDMADTRALLLLGDVMGDDLSLFPRFKEVIAVGRTPQYFVAGNHDYDFDAEADADSFDTFRREWGPEYYSFDIGEVHFVVLDNVRYPCNGVDAHDFCDPAGPSDYNGVVHERQMDWLAANLAEVPEGKLIVLSAHIPFQTYTDNTAAKHQTDNFAEIAELLEGRRVLALSGHTHTTEQLIEGVSFEGWEENTGLAEAPFHLIVAGAVSGSWWAGDLDHMGVPHATQRLGAPRGYLSIAFDGPDYVETYHAFGRSEEETFHASFNTPRFREWAERLIAYASIYDLPSDVLPPVTVNDLGDMALLTTGDLEGGTWAAVNVWLGGRETEVRVTIEGAGIEEAEPIEATHTQPGEGEGKFVGPDYADPWALAMQSTQGRIGVRSQRGGDDTAGYRTWQGTQWTGAPGPFQRWMLADRSAHLWRADLPSDLAPGAYRMTVEATDRHGRTTTRAMAFEVVDELPEPQWDDTLWETADEG